MKPVGVDVPTLGSRHIKDKLQPARRQAFLLVMKIFNFQIVVREETNEPGISEYNSVIIGSPVYGSIEGVTFMVEYAGKVFQITQCPDEHMIFLIPEGAKSLEDTEVVFQHNPYDEKYNVLERYVSKEEAETLEGLWLIEIRPEWSHFMEPQTRLVEV